MRLTLKSKAWWGAPKQFSTEQKERKISWLELFYDLVYVIAIAKITEYFLDHQNLYGFLEYIYFFSLIFWGWLNGSLYHDLHESDGLRTKLMTLWQILFVAALVITIDNEAENILFNITIALMLLQLFITYLWWSVGIYDKSHRKLNLPYTIFYLLAFCTLFSTLFIGRSYLGITFILALIFNYLPPFITPVLIRKKKVQLNLSSAMSERLGLFTIIVFGEVISGVINGIDKLHHLSFEIWVDFGLAIIIVFTLWWIFFTLIADRVCKKGFLTSSYLEALYLPTLISLGLIGMSFKGIFDGYTILQPDFISFKILLGCSISLFLLGLNILIVFLEFSPEYLALKKRIRLVMFGFVILFLILTLINIQTTLTFYLIINLIILIGLILILNLLWFQFNPKSGSKIKTI